MKFLYRGSYTSEGAAGLLAKGGSARVEAVEKLVDSMGGRLESMYFAFGDDDFFIVADLPDAATAASVSLTVGASGAVSASTTLLLTAQEIDSAAQLSPAYTPPGG